MYEIANYDECYRPYDKSGGELKNPVFVKLPVRPRGEGLQTLLEYRRGLEIFGIWCLLLEKSTAEKKPENRGKLLNHKGEPATPLEIAKGVSLKKKEKLVKYALSVLTTMGWVKSEQTSAELPPSSANIREDKRREEKGSKRNFVPPTPEQATAYAKEINFQLDGQYFVDSNVAKGWVVGKTKTPMKDWRAVIRTWKHNDEQQQSVVDEKLCIVDRKPSVAYQTDQKGKRIYLCADCRKYYGNQGSWGYLSPAEIERRVLAGKAGRVVEVSRGTYPRQEKIV